jgi:hypothetical protein
MSDLLDVDLKYTDWKILVYYSTVLEGFCLCYVNPPYSIICSELMFEDLVPPLRTEYL